MLSVRRWLSFTMLFIGALILAVPACGQGYDPTQEFGLKPYGGFEGGNIDSISTSNGNLNLHIPLVSYPQRGGKLHLGFYVKLANASSQVTPNTIPECTHSPFVCGYGTYNYGAFVEIIPDFLITSYGFAQSPSPHQAFATPDGAVHEMGQTSTGWLSNDASAFLCISSCTTIINRDGIRYNFGSSGDNKASHIEDPNGNYLSSIVSNNVTTGYTDTIGRTIPLPPALGNISGYAYTTDTSGCSGTLTSTSAFLWNLPGYQGGQMQYKLCFATVYYGAYSCLKTSQGTTCGVKLSTVSDLQSIVLPNNTTWTFTYDSADPNNPGNGATGNLLQVTFPTGGYLKYSYTPIYMCQLPSSSTTTTYTYAVSTRTVNANDGTGEHTQSYSFASFSGLVTTGPHSFTTSSTDPLGQKTVHTITALGGLCGFYETLAQTYDASGNLVKTAATDYHADPDLLQTTGTGQTANPITASSNVVPIRVTTTWPNGQVSKIETDYDSGTPMTGSISGTILYGLPTVKREYDYAQARQDPYFEPPTPTTSRSPTLPT